MTESNTKNFKPFSFPIFGKYRSEEKRRVIIPNEFTSYGNRVKLNLSNYVFEAKRENTYWIADDAYLDIHCVGDNIEEISDDFKENLIVAYKLYVSCDENELDSHALQLRRKVKEIVFSVEEIA